MRRPWLRLTIPTRIFLSIVLVLVAFLIASAASIYQHRRTADRLQLMHEVYLPLADSVSPARAWQVVVDTVLEGPVEESDFLSDARQLRPAAIRRALERIDWMERFEGTDDDRAALQEIRSSLERIALAYAESEEQFRALFAAQAQGDSSSAGAILDQLREREGRTKVELQGVNRLIQGRIAVAGETAVEEERQFLYAVATLTLLALFIGLVVLWWSQRLLAPLPRLQRRVAAVARGDFTGRLEATRADEIGQLTTEFERMVDAVGARDRQLREAADTLRALQQMQEQIVTGLRAGVVVVDGEGVVRSANRAAEAVLGVGHDAVDRPLSGEDLLSRLDGLEHAIETVATGGERASLVNAPMRGPDGETRFVDVLVTPFGAEESAASKRDVLLVADDTTEALRVKQRLIQTERLAAIGRMAAHVTHEVRNPLSSIGLNVELLEEEIGSSSAEAKALIRAITREIDRLTGLTEEYLRLARLPSPHLEPEQLGDIVEEVGRFVAREFETSKVTLRVETEPDLPLVASDEAQMRQALLNLLRNARESMQDGGEVRLIAKHDRGGMIIEVSDQGDGIPAAQKPRIFDLFYSTRERGTGLGLPLTMQIVSAHGGTITCDDGEDGGTVFTIRLPEASADERRSAVEAQHTTQ